MAPENIEKMKDIPGISLPLLKIELILLQLRQ